MSTEPKPGLSYAVRQAQSTESLWSDNRIGVIKPCKLQYIKRYSL